MNHTLQELVAAANEYFPKGIPGSDPMYGQTPEARRQKAARASASARYDDWQAMLSRLADRFPADQFPGVAPDNWSTFLQVAEATTRDRCYTGVLWLPSSSPEKRGPKLEFLVSFVVPYYVIYSSRLVEDVEKTAAMRASQAASVCVFVNDACFVLPVGVVKPELLAQERPLRAMEQVRSFAFSADEQPFVSAIKEEIETTFPGHEPMLPEVGLTVVPDVQAGARWFGESTIFTCLFSDSM
jgi:hypothetical protein